MASSRWRVTAFDATPGAGQHDVIFDDEHDGPVGALMASIDRLVFAHPDLAARVNTLEYRIKPVHREDEIAGVPA